MKSKLKFTAILTLLLGINLFAQTFSADSKDGRNQASFISDAPLEKTVGLAAGLDATVMLNINDLTQPAKGKVKVAANNIKTGIDLRDEHLRSEMWLNASKFPYVEFQLSEIKNPSSKNLTGGQKTTITLIGKLNVHGVTKDISVPATLTYLKESEKTKGRAPGNLLVVNTEFLIRLADYGIAIPAMVAGKLGEEIKITANFIASDANTGGANPCEPKQAACNPCAPKKK